MLPGPYLMCLRIDMLDIQHNQIGGCGQTVKAPEPFRMLRSKGDAGGVQTGMNSSCPCGLKKLCDKIAIIKAGRLVKSGPTAELVGDSSLEDVFLELEGET